VLFCQLFTELDLFAQVFFLQFLSKLGVFKFLVLQEGQFGLADHIFLFDLHVFEDVLIVSWVESSLLQKVFQLFLIDIEITSDTVHFVLLLIHILVDERFHLSLLLRKLLCKKP